MSLLKEPPLGVRRGVSDAVGFVVVFAVVVIAVSLVYTLGIGSLQDLQRAQQADNAQRAFETVADNMADVGQAGVPGRSTEFQLGGGAIGSGDTVTFRVAVRGDPNATIVVTTVPTQYHFRETSMHYVSGAVVRTDRDQSVMTRPPPFRFAEDWTILSFIRTIGPNRRVGGDGTVRITGRQRGPPSSERVTNRSEPPFDFDITFNVSTTTDRAGAWERHLEDELDWEADPCAVLDGSTVTCQFSTDLVLVRRTTVETRVSN